MYIYSGRSPARSQGIELGRVREMSTGHVAKVAGVAEIIKVPELARSQRSRRPWSHPLELRLR